MLIKFEISFSGLNIVSLALLWLMVQLASDMSFAAKVLVNVNVWLDVVHDKLNNVEEGVQRWPVQFGVIAHIPLILRVAEV